MMERSENAVVAERELVDAVQWSPRFGTVVETHEYGWVKRSARASAQFSSAAYRKSGPLNRYCELARNPR